MGAAVRYLPHEVADLSVVKTYLMTNDHIKESKNWHLRYLFQLWMSLICMLPFDLARFDEHESSETAKSIEEIGMANLGDSGLTREGASLILSRLYMR